MQALELIVSRIPCQRVDRRDRKRIVCGELRKDRIRHGEQRPGAGKIADVSVHLARKWRVASHSLPLAMADVRVPVGAFDEPHEQSSAVVARQRHEPLHHRAAALLIGLHRETEPLPARKLGRFDQPHEQFEGQIEAARLFLIDVQPDVPLLCRASELQQLRKHLPMYPLPLRPLVPGLQACEFDRDSRPLYRTLSARRTAYSLDSMTIGVEIGISSTARQR